MALRGDYFVLQHNGIDFARLSNKFCDEVRPLELLQIDFQAHVRKEDWVAIFSDWNFNSAADNPPRFSLRG